MASNRGGSSARGRANIPAPGKRPRTTLEHVLQDAIAEARAMGISVPDDVMGDIPSKKARVGRPKKGEEGNNGRGGYDYRCEVKCPFCGTPYTTKPGIMYHLKNRVCVSYDDVSTRDKTEDALTGAFGYGVGHPDPSQVLSITGGTIRGGVHGQRWGRGRVIGTRGRGGGRGGATSGGRGRGRGSEQNQQPQTSQPSQRPQQPSTMQVPGGQTEDRTRHFQMHNAEPRRMISAPVSRTFWQGDDETGGAGAFDLFGHMYTQINEYVRPCENTAGLDFGAHVVCEPQMKAISKSETKKRPKKAKRRSSTGASVSGIQVCLQSDGPVWAMDAKSIPDAEHRMNIFLCTASHDRKTPLTPINVSSCFPSRNYIHVWKLSSASSSNTQINLSELFKTTQIELAYSFVHDGGNIHDIQWNPLPSSTSISQNILGTVSVVSADGYVRLYMLPTQRFVQSITTHPVVMIFPVAIVRSSSTLFRIARWNLLDSHLIACAGDAASVSVYSIGDGKSDFRTIARYTRCPSEETAGIVASAIPPLYELLPRVVCEAPGSFGSTKNACFIRNIDWHFSEPTCIWVMHNDAYLRLWDIRDPWIPIREKKMALDQAGALVDAVNGPIISSALNPLTKTEFTTSTKIRSTAAHEMWSIDALNIKQNATHTCILAYASINGEVTVSRMTKDHAGYSAQGLILSEAAVRGKPELVYSSPGCAAHIVKILRFHYYSEIPESGFVLICSGFANGNINLSIIKLNELMF